MSGSKSSHGSWGGDRTGCQAVNLPMLAGDEIKKGCQVVNLPILAEKEIVGTVSDMC